MSMTDYNYGYVCICDVSENCGKCWKCKANAKDEEIKDIKNKLNTVWGLVENLRDDCRMDVRVPLGVIKRMNTILDILGKT